LATLAKPFLDAKFGRAIADEELALVAKAMPVLTPRATTILEVAQGAEFLIERSPIAIDEKAQSLLQADANGHLGAVHKILAALPEWDMEPLEVSVKKIAEEAGVGLGKVAQPLRAALTGRATSPGIFDVLLLLGREESLARIEQCLGGATA
jgi:glutamyl-tRNA synthetase